MKIRYQGIGNREWGPYVWNQDNGYVVDVPDIKLAAELVTYPGMQFVLENADEMHTIVSFVEGDSRPVEELKAKGKSKKRSSNKDVRSIKSGRS